MEAGWEASKAAALVAYLQRLGTDIYATPDTQTAGARAEVAPPEEASHAAN